MPQAENASSRRPVIYVIDDEKPVAALLESLLLEEGYEVFVSYDGQQALAELENLGSPVDLFIVDVVLPGLSGPDLAHELRKRVAEAQIVFTSGFGEGAGVALRNADPKAEFLSKPFDLDELLRVVKTSLGARGLLEH